MTWLVIIIGTISFIVCSIVFIGLLVTASPMTLLLCAGFALLLGNKVRRWLMAKP